MIGPDRLARVTASAVVPEQVVPYVCAVSGSQPKIIGSCLGYESGGHLVLLGYPLHDPGEEKAMTDSVEEGLKMPGLKRITVLGPARPPQAPAGAASTEDVYYALSLPPAPPSQKLRNLLRRAGRELTLERGHTLSEQHSSLVRKYLKDRPLAPGTRHIFSRLAQYVDSSLNSMVVSARLPEGGLAGFSIGEFASLHTAFFMFCFRDQAIAPPGSADLLFSALLGEAARRGHSRMNLGLGVNEGIRFFKSKWGAEPFLPALTVSWNLQSPGFFTRLLTAYKR